EVDGGDGERAAEAEQAGAGDDVDGIGAREEVDVEVGRGGAVDGARVEQGQNVGGGVDETHEGGTGDGVAGAHEVLAERHADVDGVVADGVDAAEQSPA